MKILKAMVRSILLALIVLANRLLMALNGALLYIAARIAGAPKKMENPTAPLKPQLIYALLAPTKPATTATAKRIIENTCGGFTGFAYDMPVPDAKLWGYDITLDGGHRLHVKHSEN